MYIFMLMGMLAVLSGCEWIKEDLRQEAAQYQAQQQWRQAHPLEAAQIDLVEAQTAAQYQRMFNPIVDQPRPRCGYVSVNGRLQNVCY